MTYIAAEARDIRLEDRSIGQRCLPPLKGEGRGGGENWRGCPQEEQGSVFALKSPGRRNCSML
jgi:hypothetical protein